MFDVGRMACCVAFDERCVIWDGLGLFVLAIETFKMVSADDKALL